MEADGSYDAVVCRHLVWTLTDPAAALRDWARVLKPGGRLMIFDGDYVKLPWHGILARSAMMALERWSGPDRHRDPALNEQHARIVAGLPFSGGLRFSDLAQLAGAAGFTDVERLGYSGIAAAQRSVASTPQDWLRTFHYSRFVLVAVAQAKQPAQRRT
jgi:SAM-dependent methyltransferase